MNLKVGDAVQLVNTNIPRLEGTRAEIVELTSWGAHVQAPAAETGRYRAGWDEMMPYNPPQAKRLGQGQAKESGYTGDFCSTCGSVQVRRNGSCLLCDSCGTTSGCS